jgi:hypothetical protein
MTIASRKGFKPLMITPDVISRLNDLSSPTSDTSSHLEFRGESESDHLFADENQLPESIGEYLKIEKRLSEEQVQQVREPEPDHTDDTDFDEPLPQQDTPAPTDAVEEASPEPANAMVTPTSPVKSKRAKSPISQARAQSNMKIDGNFLNQDTD